MGRSQGGGKAGGYSAKGGNCGFTNGRATAQLAGSSTNGKAAFQHCAVATHAANRAAPALLAVTSRSCHGWGSAGLGGVGDVTLKDLLAQVAPQARISAEPDQREFDYSSNDSVARAYAAYGGRCSGGGAGIHLDPAQEEIHALKGRNKISIHRAIAGAGAPLSCDVQLSEVGPAVEEEEPENEDFMEHWKSLFSKGSPLHDGTARDPFKEDLRRRTEVSWKKNKDRSGHRARYQARRQLREAEPAEPSSGAGGSAAGSATDHGMAPITYM